MSTGYCMTILCWICIRMNIWKKTNFEYEYMHIWLLSGFIFNISGKHWSLPWFLLIVFLWFFLQVVSTCVLFCLVLLLDGFSSLIFIYKVFLGVKADIWIWAGHMCCIITLSLSHTQWNCAWDLNGVRTSVRRFSLFVLGENH
jgi:hypothetical protein